MIKLESFTKKIIHQQINVGLFISDCQMLYYSEILSASKDHQPYGKMKSTNLAHCRSQPPVPHQVPVVAGVYGVLVGLLSELQGEQGVLAPWDILVNLDTERGGCQNQSWALGDIFKFSIMKNVILCVFYWVNLTWGR